MSMRLYVECYDKRGEQILGNLDGQASVEAGKDAEDYWDRIVHGPRYKWTNTHMFKLTDADGRVVKQWFNNPKHWLHKCDTCHTVMNFDLNEAGMCGECREPLA